MTNSELVKLKQLVASALHSVGRMAPTWHKLRYVKNNGEQLPVDDKNIKSALDKLGEAYSILKDIKNEQ